MIETFQECSSSGVPEDHPVAGVPAECIAAVTGERPAFTMCPGVLDVSHGPEEAVDVESLFQNALVYALAAVRLLS